MTFKTQLSKEELFAQNHPDTGEDEVGDGADAEWRSTDDAVAAAGTAAAAEAASTTSTPASTTAEPTSTEQQQAAGSDAATTATPTATAATTAAAPTPPAEPVGRDRRIVQAARASEQRALKQVARFKAELDALKAKIPAAEAPKLTPEIRKDVETYAPEAVGYLQHLEQENADLKKQVPTSTAAAAEEFVPETLPPDIQAVVDENDDLLAWQLDPDQTNYIAAGAFNEALLATPKWARATPADRFAECVRLVKAQNVAAAPPAAPSPPARPTAADAKAVLEAKATEAPVSIDDIRGRTQPAPIASKRAEWKNLSNEQLVAQLPEY